MLLVYCSHAFICRLFQAVCCKWRSLQRMNQHLDWTARFANVIPKWWIVCVVIVLKMLHISVAWDGEQQVKVVKKRLSLCLTKHHTMKNIEDWRYGSTHSELQQEMEVIRCTLVSRLPCDWIRCTLVPPLLCDWVPSFHWTGWCMGSRNWYGRLAKAKVSFPCRKSNHELPLFQLTSNYYTDWDISALKIVIIVKFSAP
jgi:hypothetical protein